MPAPVLTSNASFTCPHGGTGTTATGLTISALATNVTINGHPPILAGAIIGGFTPALGCTFQISGAPAPCTGFILPPPSGAAFTIGGQPVYTAADAAAIALIPSTGNATPGLKVNESQTLVLA
jgi:hypothetical protein